ncbi:MAG TPA: hypothetical protein VHJ69_08305 [Gemmatimonadales bacterium]|jgi:hypothetical protein|nr:hypothetical protein [Gemmatimonadales bacterium]
MAIALIRLAACTDRTAPEPGDAGGGGPLGITATLPDPVGDTLGDPGVPLNARGVQWDATDLDYDFYPNGESDIQFWFRR